MSFFRAFNTCCPFCITPNMDLEDDYPDLDGMDDDCYFGISEYEKKYKRLEKRKRFERYEICNNNNNNDKSNNNNSNNTIVELEMEEPKQPQNISNIIVDDILSKIVY